jgi:uncharacterized membrane protein
LKQFQRISDWAAESFGSPWFMVFHIVWWGSWIIFKPEPFPFGLLTLIVSLESILLSGLILNATNRSGELDRKIISRDLDLDKETHRAVIQILEKLTVRE